LGIKARKSNQQAAADKAIAKAKGNRIRPGETSGTAETHHRGDDGLTYSQEGWWPCKTKNGPAWKIAALMMQPIADEPRAISSKEFTIHIAKSLRKAITSKAKLNFPSIRKKPAIEIIVSR
jgi:hypothetical protein